jgi:glutamyl-tRNA synthetase
MQATPLAERVALCVPFLEQAGWVATPVTAAERAVVARIVEAASDRIKVSGDVLDYDEFFVADDVVTYDDKAFDKRIRNAAGAADLLAAFRNELAIASSFDSAALEKLAQAFVEARGHGLGAIVHALRVAVTGKAVGFGLFDILSILGKERVVARIDRALVRLTPPDDAHS